MEFLKVEGLGNDFILFTEDVVPDAESVRRWCERRTGIGADGVLTAVPTAPGRVRMRYWNADGSEVEMCGNGLRCVAQVARDRGWVDGDDFIVESPIGDHPVHVGPDTVRAFVGSPHQFRTATLKVGGHEVYPVGIGNPHAVLFVEDVDAAPVTEVGPLIENDPIFPGRTNVEFVEVTGEDRIAVRVWERGVGETRASGTGATAAAYAAFSRDLVTAPVTVELRGGELRVEFDDAGAWMDGPVSIVFSGSV